MREGGESSREVLASPQLLSSVLEHLVFAGIYRFDHKERTRPMGP